MLQNQTELLDFKVRFFFFQHYYKKKHFFAFIHEHVLLMLSNNELFLNRNAFSADHMLIILKAVKNKFFCILENDKKTLNLMVSV